MLKHWAFIFCSPGYNRADNTVTMNNGNTKVTLIGIDMHEREQSIEIAKDLVNQGCQMIELCGAFGPIYIAKIKEATGYKIPVGSTMYGPEDRGPMLELTQKK